MPVIVEWANTEETVVKFVISGDFASQDFVDAIKDYAGLADAVDHEFYMLLDFTAASGSAIATLTRFPDLARALPRHRAAAIIVVGNSSTFALAASIFSRVYGGKHEYFTSMDEALAHFRDAFGVHLD
jgi:hypothetical protein